MFKRRTISTIATTVTLLVAIASTLFFPTSACANLKRRDSKPGCDTSQSCCCRAAIATRSCCCQRDDRSSPSAPSLPDDSGRIFKWVSWVEAPLAMFVVTMSEEAAPSPGRSYFSTFERAIQSLLCVWRT